MHENDDPWDATEDKDDDDGKEKHKLNIFTCLGSGFSCSCGKCSLLVLNSVPPEPSQD